MIDEIIKKIDDKNIKKTLMEFYSKNHKNIKNFILSSPFALSIINKNPLILEDFYKIETNNKEYLSIIQKNSTEFINYLYNRYNNILISKDYDYIFRQLRNIKNHEMVLISIYSFFNLIDFKQNVFLISKLADFCIDIAMNSCIFKNQTDNDSFNELKENLIIIGLGKYGGNELNYSSDIDLILLCKDEYLNENNIKNLQILIKNFLDFLRINSQEGFLYRVDLRLRPEGISGPLIMGINNALEYYKTRGRQWEFQALIKSRNVWGSNTLYNKFNEAITPLIYRQASVEYILSEIKNTKNKIEKEITNRNIKQLSIKLSPGGIRDIEFIIQLLQLIHGVKYTEIRKNNSLNALDSLKTFNIITENEYLILKDNYIFLRSVENILQFSNNLPMQSIPQNDEEILKLFSSYNLDSNLNPDLKNYPLHFKKILNDKMQKIRKIFNSLFEETIRYIKLKNNIIKMSHNLETDLIDDHFYRMDSEYFLKFSESDIIKHIEMISKLNLDNLVEIDLTTENNNLFNLTIVAFDYSYEFSKIAGLISANYLEIINGESFTYSDYEEKLKSDKRNNFYHRLYKTKINLDNKNILRKKKIVFISRVKPVSKKIKTDWYKFKNELNTILKFLEKGDQKEASNIINIKIFNVLKDLGKTFQAVINPIEINIDNESSDHYTILHISSNDSFAFLYIFTNVLAMRDYYIFKIEINTINDTVKDRLFIMTGDGNKITSSKKIKDLEITITMIKQYSSLLFNAVDPNKALEYFDKLLCRIFESEEKNELPILGQKDVLEKLAKIFGISDFIWEDLFRLNYQTFLPLLSDDIINIRNDKNTLIKIFNEKYCNREDYLTKHIDDFKVLINKFKDEESFRIDLRQIFNKIDFFEFAEELTVLSEVIIELSFNRIEHEIINKYNFKYPPPWAVFGLGKLGGRELGYASDIELMFVYDVPDDMKGNLEIQNYFDNFLRLFLKIIEAKREGIFEIDLNLRPYGKKGNLAVSLESFKKYFSPDGEAYFFERQALVKLKFIVSNYNGKYLESIVDKEKDNFVYSDKPVDFESFTKIRKMQLDNYIKNNDINIKYSRGGLVDIEYFVQILQIHYGKKIKSLRKASTLEGINALYYEKIINNDVFNNLKNIYIFYRNLINILRMVKGNSKDLTINYDDTIKINYLVKRSYLINIIDNESKEELLQKIKNYMNIIATYMANINNYVN
jgi:glutamate-ammonia-ligase adenylyltransferase